MGTTFAVKLGYFFMVLRNTHPPCSEAYTCISCKEDLTPISVKGLVVAQSEIGFEVLALLVG